MKRTLPLLDIAHALHERGANVIPLAPASKEPIGKWAHWATHPQAWADVERLLGQAGDSANIAALAGIHSQAVERSWGYLAMLDCDSRDALDIARALVKTALGAESLISLTARGGHIWLRTPQPVKNAKWAGVELRGYRSYVVAPPSLHPSGAKYRWLDESAEILRCDALPGIPWQYVERDRLPRLAAAIMRGDPQVLARYATRSEADYALIVSLVNIGARFERVKECYIASRHPKHLPQDKNFERRLRAEYLRAKELGHKQEYTSTREFAQRVKLWALSADFVGTSPRTRETDRRVLVAHCERAFKAGKSEWHMSIRDIETQAKVSTPTASKATRRLVKAGLLKRGRSCVGRYAQSYGWGDGVPRFTHLLTLPPSVCKCVNVGTPTYATHPAFEHAGLGRYAARIFDVLAALGEAKVKQLVAEAGCAKRTVYRHLRIMLQLQLVGHDPDKRTWWACPDMLDGVAHMLQTHHVPAARAARIERERAAYRRRLCTQRQKEGKDRR